MTQEQIEFILNALVEGTDGKHAEIKAFGRTYVGYVWATVDVGLLRVDTTNLEEANGTCFIDISSITSIKGVVEEPNESAEPEEGA